MLDWRKDKKLPKETVRCIYSFIHFFVLCPKSIPFLYFSLDHNGNYLRWHDHFRSISGIICSLRIICGWGSFTILYTPVTNDAISCNYSNYCIQNKDKNSYENDTDDTQYLIDDTLSGCPPKSGPASLGSPVNLPFIFCGWKGLNEEWLKSS